MAHIPMIAGLTDDQQRRVLKLYVTGASISHIACRLALTREYVQTYLRAHKGEVYNA